MYILSGFNIVPIKWIEYRIWDDSDLRDFEIRAWYLIRMIISRMNKNIIFWFWLSKICYVPIKFNYLTFVFLNKICYDTLIFSLEQRFKFLIVFSRDDSWLGWTCWRGLGRAWWGASWTRGSRRRTWWCRGWFTGFLDRFFNNATSFCRWRCRNSSWFIWDYYN